MSTKSDDNDWMLLLLFLLELLGKFKIPIIIPPEKDKDKKKEPPPPDEKPTPTPEPVPNPIKDIEPKIEPTPTPIPKPILIQEPTPIPEPVPNPFYTNPQNYGIPTTKPEPQPYPDVVPSVPMVEIPPWTQLTLPFSITPEDQARLEALGLEVGVKALETSIIAFATGTTLTASAYAPALLTAIAGSLAVGSSAIAKPTPKRKQIKFEPEPVVETPIEPEPTKKEFHNAPSWKWGL